MRWIAGLMVVLGASACGCASDARSSGGAGGSGAAGGRSSAGATSDTAACPVWPASRLMPLVGPFFYGPDPGPCSDSVIGFPASKTSYHYANGQLSSQTVESDEDQRTRTYLLDAEGKIVSSNSSTGEFSHIYEYGPDYLLDTTTDRDGALSKRERYSLSATGYPLSSHVTEPNDVTYDTQYNYLDCQLITVTRTDFSGAEVKPLLSYAYDAAGHVAALYGAEYEYAYDCWR